MKKQILTFVALLAMTVAGQAQTVNYEIHGTVPANMDGYKVYLRTLSGRIDSTTVKNGQFDMQGNLEKGPIMGDVLLETGNQKNYSCLVACENGPLYLKYEKQYDELVIEKGGPLNQIARQRFERVFVGNAEQMMKIKEILPEYHDATTSAERKRELSRQIMSLEQHRMDSIRTFILDNLDNIVGGYSFGLAPYGLPAEDMDKIAAGANEAFLSQYNVQRKLTEHEATKISMPGRMFTDFEQPDKNGRLHKLSEYVGRGKCLLVDFWASWCDPCRAEMPNVKAAYEKYHAKGFEIVGISLDNKQEAWLQAIEQLGLEWEQLSDLQGWQCAAAKTYKVNGIPFTLLIGADGKIIAKNLRGEALGKKLAEILGE